MTGWTSIDFLIDAAVFIGVCSIASVLVGLLLVEIVLSLKERQRRKDEGYSGPRFYRPKERTWR